jgi:hypothetical protein
VIVMSRHRRILAGSGAAVIAAAAALGASGCGSSNVVDPVAQAATTSAGAPGFRMTFSLQMRSSQLPIVFTGTGNGSFDVAHHAGALALDMTVPDVPQVTQALGGNTLHLEELIKGLTIYMKLPPALADRLPGVGAHWVKIDLAKQAAAAGIPGLASLANNPLSSDPSQFLQYLRAVSGSITNVGVEAVGGFVTTHYRATVSLDRVPDALPPAARRPAAATIAALKQAVHANSLPVDVWIDRQHLVRRIKIVLDVAAQGQNVSMVMTSDFPVYGPQPSPKLPPEDQVTDAGGLLGSGG